MAKQKPVRISFTDRTLTKLPTPPVGRRYWYDQKVPGLAFCITANDTRTFYLYRRIGKRPVRVRLGRFPELDVDAARDLAREKITDIARGRDPQEERQAAREETTWSRLFDLWFAKYGTHLRTGEESNRIHQRLLKRLHNLPITRVGPRRLQHLHHRLTKRHGAIAANRALELCRRVFNHAKDLVGFKRRNPVKGLVMNPETSRDRFLQPTELKPFFQALHDEEPLFRDLFLMLLFTGARRSAVQAMRWEQISFELEAWRIPAEESKNKQVLMISLSPPALAILRERKEAGNGSPWVFPTRAKSGHVEEVKSAWRRVLERAGLNLERADRLRPHDLRRSLGSYMAIGNASLPLIGAALGHKNLSSTQIYARLNLNPVRAAVERATATMLSFENPPAIDVSATEAKG